MKLNRPKKEEPQPKRRSIYDQASSKYSGSSSGDSASWAVTDPTAFDGLKKQSQGRGTRELWVKENEKVTIRFRCSEPLASFERYRFKSNGRWAQATKPQGGIDLFAKNGLRASRVFVYEVLDRSGYKNKKTGKVIRNSPRFYVVGARIYEQIQALRQATPDGKLTKFDIIVSRSGTGTQTAYMFIPQAPSPLPEEAKQQPRLAEEWATTFAPPTEAEQRAYMGNIDSDDE